MKIALSPTKTMVNSKTIKYNKPIFECHEILETLNKLDIENIKHVYNVKESMAKKIHELINNYYENSTAIFSFTGIQYKYLDINSLNNSLYSYIKNNIIILSALYGVICPFDTISNYRLDLNDNIIINNKNLTEYWKPKVYELLKNEIIISLASEEYNQIFSSKLNVIKITFKDCKKKVPSTYLKISRGLFAREIILNEVSNIDDLKKIKINDYIYNENLSSKSEFIYIK